MNSSATIKSAGGDTGDRPTPKPVAAPNRIGWFRRALVRWLWRAETSWIKRQDSVYHAWSEAERHGRR